MAMMNSTAAAAATLPINPALAVSTPPPELLFEVDPVEPVDPTASFGPGVIEAEGLGVGMSLVGMGVGKPPVGMGVGKPPVGMGVGKPPVGMGVGLSVGCFVGLGVGKPPVGFGDDVGAHVSVVGIWDGSLVSDVAAI
jgi:hypothetical protein